MLGIETMRFVRTRWKSVQPLAEELFSIFSAPLDITPSSITINQPPGATQSPITITQPAGSTAPPITVTRGGVAVNIGGDSGGPDLGQIQFPGQDPADPGTPPPALNPISLHGVVVAKSSGNVYTVKCWARSPDQYSPVGVLTVQFPAVDPDDTIPAGTPCPVIMFPKNVLGVIQPDKTIGYVSTFSTPEGV